MQLLPFHALWSAQWLAALVRERGRVHFYNLGDTLSDADVQRIAPALLPVLQSWETREREWQLVAIAQSLGRRLRVFDGLVEILERLLERSHADSVAERALEVIASHRPDRLAALVLRLIAQDMSWATRRVAYTYLHRRRQDLLGPFLGQEAYRGRFSTGRTRFVLPLLDGFHRWTAGQQRTFAQTLSDVIEDGARDTQAARSPWPKRWRGCWARFGPPTPTRNC